MSGRHTEAHAANLVAIDETAVDSLALVVQRAAREHEFIEEAWSDPKFWNVAAPRAERCQYLAVGNAINFRFWSLVDGKVVPAVGTVHGETLRGAMYMWRRLRLALQRGELTLDASDLAGLEESAFRDAFRDDDGQEPLAEGLQYRLENLRNLGSELCNHWAGSFERVVDKAACSLGRFVELSSGFRAFDDPVQKLTMLNAIMLQGSGLTSFDESPLPAIDYHLVKQSARQGLVVLDPSLEIKLREGRLLERGESDTLRTAVRDGLVAVAAKAGVSSALLDNIYWRNRRICADESPQCSRCPLSAGCAMRTDLGLPLELTRYY